jgi:hypothetical protein
VTDLDAIAAEMAEARRYQLAIMAACCEHVIAHAEHDDQARTLAFLLRDADRRCEVARFHAQFQLPSETRTP